MAAKGKHLKQPCPRRFKILVPVSGSGVSRRGAEVAVALAHAGPGSARSVIYVSTTRDKGAQRGASGFSNQEDGS